MLSQQRLRRLCRNAVDPEDSNGWLLICRDAIEMAEILNEAVGYLNAAIYGEDALAHFFQ